MVEICNELKNKKPSTIYSILKRLGVKARKQIIYNNEKIIKNRKFSLNDNYFEQISTPEQSYWLGFLYADGYLTTNSYAIGISLKIDDKEHLEKFKKAIEYTGSVKTYKQTSGYIKRSKNDVFYCRLIFNSRVMKEHLIKLGMLEKKTLILKFPSKEQVPKHLLSHFIRGFMDGNGSITHSHINKQQKMDYKISFCGTEDMLNGIQKFFNSNLKLQKYKSRKAFSLDYGGNKQVLRLLHVIYTGANQNIYLERKHNKYKQIISELSS